jgi:ABC-type transport system substrate-binding protein
MRNGSLDPALAARGVHTQAYHYTTRMALFNMDDPVVGGMSRERVALRRAIALALEADKLTTVVYGGQATPANQLLARGVAGFDAARPGKRLADRGAANALLDRVGYGKLDKEGYRLAPDGKPLALTMTTFTGTQWREMQALWKDDMRAIGIRMDFRPVPPVDLFREVSQGTYQVALSGNSSSPVGLELLTLHSKEPGGTNGTRFKLEAFDRALERFMRAGTEQQRIAESRTMNEIVDNYVPLIPMVAELEIAFVQPWVRGFRGSPYVTYYYQYLDVDSGKARAPARP